MVWSVRDVVWSKEKLVSFSVAVLKNIWQKAKRIMF